MNTPNAAAAGTVSIGEELVVNRLGFGAMRLTGEGIWDDPKDPAECKRVLKRLLDLNVNFIDTADSYGPEVSENLIAAHWVFGTFTMRRRGSLWICVWIDGTPNTVSFQNSIGSERPVGLGVG